MKEYKKKIEFKEIQSLEYNLLKRFDEFAKENNIMYFLSGGSWGDIGLYHSVDYYSYGAYRSRETRHEGGCY